MSAGAYRTIVGCTSMNAGQNGNVMSFRAALKRNLRRSAAHIQKWTHQTTRAFARKTHAAQDTEGSGYPFRQTQEALVDTQEVLQQQLQSKQDVLRQLDDLNAAFRQTQDALFQTQDAFQAHLQSKQDELDELRKAFRETQNALFQTRDVFSAQLQDKEKELDDVTGAFKTTQEALFHTQNVLQEQLQAFRQTQDALFYTQGVLKEQSESKQKEIDELRTAFEKTQAALFHTQDVLREQQVSFGLIDPISKTEIIPDREIPSILILGPPKCAGSYIMHTLLHGLRLQRRWITNGTFMPDLIRQDSLESFWKERGCIAFHHTDASDNNLFLLEQTDLKVLVNVRDPRQCMVSIVYYSLAHFPRGSRLVHRHEPPDDFPMYTLEQQIEWAIDKHLQNYIDWISGWEAAINAGRVQALVTDYTELLQDEAALFHKITNFYEIPNQKFKHPRLLLDARVNFRSGEANEWERLFTQSQKDRAKAMIPARLATRFGWSY